MKRSWGSLKNGTVVIHSLLELEGLATGRTGRFCKAIFIQRPCGYFHTNKTLTSQEPFSGCIQQKCAPCFGYDDPWMEDWVDSSCPVLVGVISPNAVVDHRRFTQHSKVSALSGVHGNCREELGVHRSQCICAVRNILACYDNPAAETKEQWQHFSFSETDGK